MSVLNSNIPSFKGFVRKSFFTKNELDKDDFFNVYVFAIQLFQGKYLHFMS